MRKLILLAALLILLPGIASAQPFIRYYPPSGVAELTSNGTALTSTVPIVLPNGTVTAPALTWTGASNWGLYKNSSNYIGFAILGVDTVGITSSVHWKLVSAGQLAWSSTSALSGTTDLLLSRDAAGTLAQKNGNNDQKHRLYGTNGGYWEKGVASELLTIAAAATTDTSANLLPADSVIEAVTVRVTTEIPTAATFTVGDATTADRFATGVAVAAGTTAVGLSHRQPDVAAAAGPVQTAAAKVRITPNASPGAATGVVRIQVFYSRWVAPTT